MFTISCNPVVHISFKKTLHSALVVEHFISSGETDFLRSTSWETNTGYCYCCPVAKLCPTVTPWTEAIQASLSFFISQNLLRFMSIESMTLSEHLIRCHPFSFCLQSFPASGSLPMNRLIALGGQRAGASALTSALLVNKKEPKKQAENRGH